MLIFRGVYVIAIRAGEYMRGGVGGVGKGRNGTSLRLCLERREAGVGGHGG